MLPDDTTPELYMVGQIETIFFESATNFYKVMLINITETNTDFPDTQIVVTGTFGQIREEESYRFVGNIIQHPKYGEQFQVTHYQQDKPSSSSGLIHYLSSDQFPGIGPKTAKGIIDELGLEAIDLIIEDATILERVPGLNAKKRQTLVDTLKKNYGMEQVVIRLNEMGFGNQLAFSIYQFYKEKTLEIIEENPYQLVEDIDGVGFKKADNLAEKIGIEADSPRRIRAAIIHELFQDCLASGNTYMEAKQLLGVTLTTLESSRAVEINPEAIADEIIRLGEEEVIVQEGTRLYEKSLYFSEIGMTTSIRHMLKRKKKIVYKEKDIDATIAMVEKQSGMTYGESQRLALKEAIRSPFFILTGGPGTGKTTVINGIVNLFAELNGLSLDITDYTQEVFPILLAAPTGRAAKRMNDMTGLPASTIHRLLGLTGQEKDPLMDGKELEGGLLIVDEMSMVDTWLANTLLKAIPTNMQVIFVGDKDQLPSVGPGQVLTDLLGVPDIPKRELVDIYRQEDGSTIISLAHEMKEGRLPADFMKNQKDRSFIPCRVDQIESVVGQVVERAKVKKFEAQDIQVLAPMYRGKAGIDQLNIMMQGILNNNDSGKRKEVTWMDKTYRIGDKVLHLVNSPESNVFNGDIGVITGITYGKETEDKIDEMTLLFDDIEVVYKRNEWHKFTLAYACSIHKSQGSEFSMVILPLVKQYGRMLQRKLVYTAVTRSKDFLILVGEVEAFQQAIESETLPRQTTLQLRLTNGDGQLLSYEKELENEVKQRVEETRQELTVETKPQEEPIQELSLFQQDEVEENSGTFILTPEMIRRGMVDPMIGMTGCSPYDYN